MEKIQDGKNLNKTHIQLSFTNSRPTPVFKRLVAIRNQRLRTNEPIIMQSQQTPLNAGKRGSQIVARFFSQSTSVDRNTSQRHCIFSSGTHVKMVSQSNAQRSDCFCISCNYV